jgi:hypothetical protein
MAARGVGRAAAAVGIGGRAALGVAGSFAGGLITAVIADLAKSGLAMVMSLRTITEGVNAANRQFVRYNPRIAAGHAMLQFGDFRRNVMMGRELQEVATILAGNVNRMRDAWQGYDSFTARVRNGFANFGAGVMTEIGNGASQMVQGLNAWLKANDPAGQLQNRAGSAVGGAFSGAVGGWLGGGLGGALVGAGQGAMKAWNKPAAPAQPMASPWSGAMHQIVKQGPLVRPHRVPPP